MGLFSGIFGGIASGNTKQNSTTSQTTDSSHREVISSGGSGSSINGSSNIINDSSLVQMGIQNNDLAATTLAHINDTAAATIAKLADIVKGTSNDVLQSAVSNGATLQAVSATNATNKDTGLLSSFSDSQQKIIAIGAAVLGAWYFLKGKK